MRKKLYFLGVLLFAFLLVGFAVAQNKDIFTASQKVDYCFAINVE